MKLELGVLGQQLLQVVILHQLQVLQEVLVARIVDVDGPLLLEEVDRVGLLRNARRLLQGVEPARLDCVGPRLLSLQDRKRPVRSQGFLRREV